MKKKKEFLRFYYDGISVFRADILQDHMFALWTMAFWEKKTFGIQNKHSKRDYQSYRPECVSKDTNTDNRIFCVYCEPAHWQLFFCRRPSPETLGNVSQKMEFSSAWKWEVRSSFEKKTLKWLCRKIFCQLNILVKHFTKTWSCFKFLGHPNRNTRHLLRNSFDKRSNGQETKTNVRLVSITVGHIH